MPRMTGRGRSVRRQRAAIQASSCEDHEVAGLLRDDQVVTLGVVRFNGRPLASKVPTSWLQKDQVVAGLLRDSVVLCRQGWHRVPQIHPQLISGKRERSIAAST